MDKLLRLKHWQLFLLLIGIPVILEIIFVGTIVTSQKMTGMIFIFPIIMILFMGTYFGWFYALGTNLHKRLPPTVEMNLPRFKIFLLIPIVYMLFIFIFMIGILSSAPQQGESLRIGMVGLIIPVHLFSMFCIFYCLYFNAKALKSVEWQRAVTFSDFVGEFFLIWFFPIGIWIIQPRINQLFEENN